MHDGRRGGRTSRAPRALEPPRRASLNLTALVSVPPLRKNRAGRACGLCSVSDYSPLAALRQCQRTTEEEFPGELSSPAPPIGVTWPYVRCGFPVQLGVLCNRAGAGDEHFGAETRRAGVSAN